MTATIIEKTTLLQRVADVHGAPLVRLAQLRGLFGELLDQCSTMAPGARDQHRRVLDECIDARMRELDIDPVEMHFAQGDLETAQETIAVLNRLPN